MTTSRFGTNSLFLSIILWGTLLGGAMYSSLVYFPAYLSALPDSAVVVNGPYGLNEAPFWLMIHPLLILSLIITLALNWKHRERRRLILITSAIYFVILVITQIYFLPGLRAFRLSAESGLSPAEWLARGQLWRRLNWIRVVVGYAAIVPLLLALTKSVTASKEFDSMAAS